MEFVAILQNSTRKIQTRIYLSSSIPQIRQSLHVEQREALGNPSKVRHYVLRRDHSRCRGCNRMGDEITLEVRRVRPDASDIEDMLTLCVRCRRIAEQCNIAARNCGEFLYLLGRYLDPWAGTASGALTEKGEEESIGNHS